MKTYKDYLKTIVLSLITLISIDLQAQLGGQNCNSAPLINIPIDGSEIELTARYDQYTTASYQGLHPCVGTLAPGNSGPDVWYKFEANTSQVLTFHFQNTVGIFLYSGNCGQLSIVDYVSPGNSFEACESKSIHPFDTQIGETYYIQVSFYSGFLDHAITVQNQVDVSHQDCNTAKSVNVSNDFSDAVVISSAQFDDSTSPASGCSAGSKDAWYSFVAPECGAVQYFVNGAQGALYGGSCGSLQLLECIADNGSTSNLTPGQTYFMQFVDDPDGFYTSYLSIVPFVGPSTTLTNVDCSTSTSININQNYSNIDLISVPLLPTTSICNGNALSQEIWYQFVAPVDGIVNTFVNGAQSELYSGSCGSLVQEPCVEDGIFEGLSSGSTYYLRLLFDADFNSNNYDLELKVPINGQVCSDALLASVNNTSCGSSISYTLNNSFKSDPCFTLPNLWVTMNAPPSGSIKIECADNGYFYSLYNNDCDDLNKISSYQGNEDVHFIHGLVPNQEYLLSIGKGSVLSPIDFCIEANNTVASNVDCNTASAVSTNTDFTYEEGKSAVEIDINNDNCEDDLAVLWYSFTVSSEDVVINGTTNEHQLFSGICGSLAEISEVNFGSDMIYENLTIGNIYYLKIETNVLSDINASSTISIDDYIKAFSGYDVCSQALSVALSDIPVAYDLGVASSFSAEPLPSCLSSSSNLIDSWITLNAINSGLYIDGVEDTHTYVLYSNNCGSLSEVSCYSSVGNDFLQFGELLAGNQYYLRIITEENSSVNISIAASTTAVNGICEAAIPVEVSVEGSTNITMNSANAVSFNTQESCDSKVSLWYEFTSPVGGNVILQNHTGGVAVYEGTCGTLTEILCNITTGSSSVEMSLSPSTTYLLRLSFDEYNSDTRSFVLIEGVPSTPESNCNQAPALGLSDMTCNMSVTSSSNGVLNSDGNFCGATKRNAVFYKFTSADDANHRFEISNSAAAHSMTIFEDCSFQNPIACGNSPIDISLINGQSYIIAIYPQVKEVTSDFELCAYISPSINDGNVGISVTNPQAKLDVNGGIRPGFTTNEITGIIRWNNDLEVYDGTEWKSTTEWDYQADQDIDMQGNRISNVSNPVLPSDVATKEYVDQFPDNDNSPSNEIQTQTLSGDTLKMSLGGGYVTFDAFYDNELNTGFSIGSDNILSLTDPGNTLSVHLSKYDNGWNYNSATDELSYSHNIGIFDTDPSQELSVNGTIRASNNETEVNYVEMNHTGIEGMINTNGLGDLSIQHGGDTKLSISSNGNVEFKHNNNTEMTILGIGNVGIGTTTPGEKFSVVGAVRAASSVTEANRIEMVHNGSNATINTVGDGTLELQHDGNTKVTIQDNGNVGIGTGTPDEELSVVGTIRASANSTEAERTEITHNGSNGIINTVGDGTLQLQHDGNVKVSIQDNGNVGIGTTTPDEELSVIGTIRAASAVDELGRIQMSHDGTDGILSAFGAENLHIHVANDTKVTIQDNGNVGIGTTTPDEELSVVGVVRASANVAETERTEMSHNGFAGIINTVGDGSLFLRHDGDTKVTIQDNGNVGVGTTTPDDKLSVIGVVSASSNEGETERVEIKHNSAHGIINTVGDGTLQFQHDGDVKVSIQDNGNVGIGTTSPDEALSVIGRVSASFSQSELERTEIVHDGNNGIINTVGDGTLQLQHDGSTKMTIQDNGNVGIGTNDPDVEFSVVGTVRASNNITETNRLDISHNGFNGFVNSVGPGDLQLQNDGSTVMTIRHNGNVGIGVLFPVADLEIAGSGNAEAILLENGNTAFQHGIDLISTKNSHLRFLLDSDNNNSAGIFELFSNQNVGNSIDAKVRFDLDGGTSYIDTGGKLGLGVTNPNDKFHIAALGENALRVQVDGGTKFRVFANGSISLGSNNSSITDNNVYVATNMGIADSNPSERLSVTGKIRASDNANELEYTEITHDGSDGIINTQGDGHLVLQHDGSTKMIVDSGGDVGVGVTNVVDRLHVGVPNALGSNPFRVDVAGQIKMRVYTNGSIALGGGNNNITGNTVFVAGKLGLGDPSPDYKLDIPNTASNALGRARANAFVTYSDKRVKKNVQSLDYGLSEILKLNPKRYNHHSSTFEGGKLVVNPKHNQAIGFIAQEVAEIIEEVVNKPEDETTDLWAMDYEKLTPVLVNAIKEQQQQIENQNELLIKQQLVIDQLLETQNEMKVSINRLEQTIGGEE